MGLSLSMRNEVYPTPSLSQREMRSVLFGSIWVYNFQWEARSNPHLSQRKQDLFIIVYSICVCNFPYETRNYRFRFTLTLGLCRINLVSHKKLQTHVQLYNNRPRFTLTATWCGMKGLVVKINLKKYINAQVKYNTKSWRTNINKKYKSINRI